MTMDYDQWLLDPDEKVPLMKVVSGALKSAMKIENQRVTAENH